MTNPKLADELTALAEKAKLGLRPVDQTVLGLGNPRANCFQACLAMISGLPLDECIDITDPSIDECHWVEPVEQWAEWHGLRFVTAIKAPTGRPYIANGPTAEREGMHGIVCLDGEMFHDPHPSRAGIVYVHWYGWLEPLPIIAALTARSDGWREGVEAIQGAKATKYTPTGARGYFVTNAQWNVITAAIRAFTPPETTT